MHRMTLAPVALLLVTAAAPAQPGAAAKLFPITSHDFGMVPRGAELLHRFAWTNPGKTRLEITEARTTCACATVSLQPRVLEPRQTGAVEVVVDAKRFVGPKTVVVHLLIGLEQPQAVTLQVSAYSRPDIVFNPGQVNFGVITEGATPGQAVEIEYSGALDWRVLELLNRSPHLDASYEEMYRRPGQVGYRVQVRLKPSTPPGDFKHELLLKTNDPLSPIVPVLVTAIVRSSLTVAPESVYFGTVRIGQSAVRRIILRSDKPFCIHRVEGMDGELNVTSPESAATVHHLSISWQPHQPGQLKRQLTIHTDLEQCKQRPLTVQGQAIP